MIDALTEELITPKEATRLFPRGPDGKPAHVSKIYRLMKQGYRGVVLESLHAPRICTSRQAVGRFLRRINSMTISASQANCTFTVSGQVDNEIEEELERLGL